MWWFEENRNKSPMPDPSELDYAPFHDAAWELSRRGILRPGPAFPGTVMTMGGAHTEGDGFSLTTAGRDWIIKYDRQGPLPQDSGRFTALVAPYERRYGTAFIQRINEAAGCYRSLNYLAACAMAGAACESILLAVAIAKSGNEESVLGTYSSRDGRRNLITQITSNTKGFIKLGIETATSLLSYWRDHAAHGHATEISEFAAHDALSRLLRFAQFVDENWPEIVA